MPGQTPSTLRNLDLEASESSALLDPSAGATGAVDSAVPREYLTSRRPSNVLQLNTLTQIGGVNSIENFAKSWTCAASFTSGSPFFPRDGQESFESNEFFWERKDVEARLLPSTALSRAQPEASRAADLSNDAPSTHAENPTNLALGVTAASHAISYGTIHRSQRISSMRNAGPIWRQQQAACELDPARGSITEREPAFIKVVEDDGRVVMRVAGQSTLPQTIFNSTNVLIGIGILSLPMGFKYAGWILGMIFLSLAALVTSYTAKLLTKCLDVDQNLNTFADLAYVSYGQKARIATTVLFTVELLAACVALVTLFADTLDLLIPGVGLLQWKILCGLFLIPLNFLPLRLLSLTSVIGIFSCFCIVSIVFIDGFIKPNTPGSLREPAKTYLFPENWLSLPLSFGLLMAPWGGHAVFPNIYRDMRHPLKFNRAVKATFTFTFFLDCSTAVAGLLMFGDDVANEITANIINTSGYPRILSIYMSIFISIIPLTKIPLNCRPILSTFEVLTGLSPLSVVNSDAVPDQINYAKLALRIVIRIMIIILLVVISTLFPAFDSVMAFMGSALCFTLCVILPVLFYLKLHGKNISLKERTLCIFLIIISSIISVLGTVFAFLPKSFIGVK
ncbi:Vacuolar amino acid transporter 1 [Podosphaera aphanis]|nr:Vacuolar amino acid transporter 1 [Podosphaera aphanis]